ncbi:pentatricopeptide repeat-containing protein At5g61370, mitochondrial isoform X1 [Ananas comosus]|uniref:Pentatricopeptide repeat-containing protein At5g61370, mitochondrial isoform X1 n=1 Tax=Ananas comosus TaxID=4615 RepID=A0A6P5G3L5_ANACO|nr:pentatricopeptide repeat-containing protein At5g61370, mitochondrial isoform X1 [Ananas comosus]XP_020103176.1 pentatricopeptide repeat-containing protein At5g61370, mitochondrial isoform X1 [Ananas comosus]
MAVKHHILFSRLRVLGFCRVLSSCTPQALSEVLASIGSLDDIEASLNQLDVEVTPAIITQVINSCNCNTGGGSSSTRKLLRFFSWCRLKNPAALGEEAFNHAIQTFAELGDITAVGISIADLHKEGGKLSPATFSLVAETLVKAGKEDEAVRLLRDLERKKLLPCCDGTGKSVWSSSLAIVHALCAKGHARKAQGVIWHHKSELSVGFAASVVQRSLLHGWCVRGNIKEARRVMGDMKSLGILLGLPSYNDLLRCICYRNLRFNPSALVSEATDLLAEMRSCGILPTASSFNILLSCLGKVRRVKEAYGILYLMRQGKAGCSPDWVSYYLVIRVLYLSGRFVRGNKLMDQMLDDGLSPDVKFYHGLIGVLCGVEKVDHALNVFEQMKKFCARNTGPTYDLLIAKLCRNGKFEQGRNLWNEAVQRGITLRCSRDLLDPLKTIVFKPRRPVNKLHPWDYKKVGYRRIKRAARTNMKMKRRKPHKFIRL